MKEHTNDIETHTGHVISYTALVNQDNPSERGGLVLRELDSESTRLQEVNRTRRF